MYPELTYAFADRRGVSHIAGFHSEDARIDTKPNLIVPQAIQPIAKGLRSQDLNHDQV